MKASKPVLLIVEDKDYIARIIEANLSAEFDCIVAPDSASALEGAQKCDAAVVSREFEDRTGLALMRRMREIKDFPVTVITNQTYSEFRIESFKAGADDVVSKPFNPEELMLRMLRLLK